MPGALTGHDLTRELWREYDFPVLTGKENAQGQLESITRIYRIEEPKALFLRPGGATHRVLDKDGVIHCVPAPGVQGCILRWKNRKGEPRARF